MAFFYLRDTTLQTGGKIRLDKATSHSLTTHVHFAHFLDLWLDLIYRFFCSLLSGPNLKVRVVSVTYCRWSYEGFKNGSERNWKRCFKGKLFFTCLLSTSLSLVHIYKNKKFKKKCRCVVSRRFSYVTWGDVKYNPFLIDKSLTENSLQDSFTINFPWIFAF